MKPTDYSDTLADEICERLADGESLRKICSDATMPTKAAVFRWLALHKSFADQYMRARETQADSFADDIADIADNPKLEPNDKRVRIDARKWLAGKLRPRVYGDRTAHEHTGAGGGPIQTVDLSKVSDDDLRRLEHVLGSVVEPGASRGAAPSDPEGADAPEG